ncbi:LRR receptor-like serine/threonine-protein kinase FLS2 [Dichanthelium oligosanthes]|uniref:LRR receptor-like serine/threonine-protein kinase FLS2 n=1 Tax=Dichanthelium oligosanthes TaxID=888268 RepID=A0A1E5W3P7_9POAL|nr:LRR receptor-like serine/threonine-protein kinase FLS2 [Dichanthelium oligosanthes]
MAGRFLLLRKLPSWGMSASTVSLLRKEKRTEVHIFTWPFQNCAIGTLQLYHQFPMFIYLYAVVMIFYSHTTVLATAEVNKSEIDRQSLLCFKSGIYSDPLGVLNAWRSTSLNFCSWPGISCSTSRVPARVVSLNLNSALLGGQIPGCVANLTSLSQMHLADNSLSGAIPDELGILAGNHLEGNFPDSLGTSMSLSYVNLANNSLTGAIPQSLASSSSLGTLILSRNSLTGSIPASLFANLSTLTIVDLQMNSLTGVIPPFGNILNGNLPGSIGNLSTNLENLLLGSNQISGSIVEISNLVNLTVLSLEDNLLSGSIPARIGKLQNLFILNLSKNKLSGQIPSTIGNVLLDYGMTARVGDFGSAKFLSQDSGGLKHLVSIQGTIIQGTIGYLVPEYVMGCGVTRQGDVYSFGVLILEMITGRRPTDEMFVDGLNLHNFTSFMFPDRIAEILDPHMAHDEHRLYGEMWMRSYIIPLVAPGLSCSMGSLKDRPGMQNVCAKLCAIKEAFLESCD